MAVLEGLPAFVLRRWSYRTRLDSLFATEEDVTIGDDEFDHRFEIATAAPTVLAKLLTGPLRADLLLGPEETVLQSWGGPSSRLATGPDDVRYSSSL